MGDWSQLIPDLLVMIAKRVQLVEDFTALRGVCSSWRAAVSKNEFVKSWPTVPLLMLAEQQDDSDYREFYSISRGKIWRTLSLPEAKGKKCIESRGWLITIGGSGEMNLLHPLSRVQIQLPHQNKFPDYEEDWDRPYDFIGRAVLSADPLDTPEFVLMVTYGNVPYLGLWRPGDTNWTRIQTSVPESDHYGLSDINFNGGKCYALSYPGHIWSWDTSERPHTSVARHLLCMDRRLLDFRESYIVESLGELLIVARNGCELGDDEETYGVTNFRIIQLDLIKGAWEEITSLGERTIFVGQNGAFSVDAAKFSGIIKPNCVYFTDDSVEAYLYTRTQQGGGKDMGIYHLEDGKIERFDDVHSFSLICPPLWVAPSL